MAAGGSSSAPRKLSIASWRVSPKFVGFRVQALETWIYGLNIRSSCLRTQRRLMSSSALPL